MYFSLALFGMLLIVRNSFQQYQSNYNVLPGGQVLYNSLFPTTNPIFTSVGTNFGYKPQQRIESIYSQTYHPEAAYVTAPPAIRQAFDNAFSNQGSGSGHISVDIITQRPTAQRPSTQPSKPVRKPDTPKPPQKGELISLVLNALGIFFLCCMNFKFLQEVRLRLKRRKVAKKNLVKKVLNPLKHNRMAKSRRSLRKAQGKNLVVIDRAEVKVINQLLERKRKKVVDRVRLVVSNQVLLAKLKNPKRRNHLKRSRIKIKVKSRRILVIQRRKSLILKTKNQVKLRINHRKNQENRNHRLEQRTRSQKRKIRQVVPKVKSQRRKIHRVDLRRKIQKIRIHQVDQRLKSWKIKIRLVRKMKSQTKRIQVKLKMLPKRRRMVRNCSRTSSL